MEYTFYVPRICLQVKKQPLFFTQGGWFEKTNKLDKISI